MPIHFDHMIAKEGAERLTREATERDIETRFWSIVDRDGLSGLPSDMWAALEILAKSHARKREEVQGSWKTSCPIDGRQCDKVPCPLRIRCEENHD